jgi:hypothetical protein
LEEYAQIADINIYFWGLNSIYNFCQEFLPGQFS